jgi:hypothetical protein
VAADPAMSDLRSRRGLAVDTVTLAGRTFTGRGNALPRDGGGYQIHVYVSEGSGKAQEYLGYGVAHRVAQGHWVAGLTDRTHRVRFRTLTAAVEDVTKAAVIAHAMKATRPDRLELTSR